MSIFVGVMPLLELRILKIHSFSHLCPTLLLSFDVPKHYEFTLKLDLDKNYLQIH